MTEYPSQVLESVALTPRRSLAESEAMIRECRPGLAADSDGFRGAVLLLLVDSFGPNVERLVRRSRLPREFVARGVRRLIDNGWLASDAAAAWCETPPACRNFWLDVDVLLGLAHRRVDESGRAEWARVGEWVKDFEYQGPRVERTAIHNQYRDFVVHDPEPELAGEEDDEREEPRGPARPATAVPVFSVVEPRERTVQPPVSGFLGILPEGEALGGPQPAEPSTPAAPRPNDAGLLVGDWSGAHWLS